MPVSALRTKIRQEFERHRYVNQLQTVDVLLFRSHQEYQVRTFHRFRERGMEREEGILEKDRKTQVVREAEEPSSRVNWAYITSLWLTTIPTKQETLNFWKQLTHILKYFRSDEDPKAALPKNFIQGFLEVSPVTSPNLTITRLQQTTSTDLYFFFLSAGTQLEKRRKESYNV